EGGTDEPGAEPAAGAVRVGSAFTHATAAVPELGIATIPPFSLVTSECDAVEGYGPLIENRAARTHAATAAVTLTTRSQSIREGQTAGRKFQPARDVEEPERRGVLGRTPRDGGPVSVNGERALDRGQPVGTIEVVVRLSQGVVSARKQVDRVRLTVGVRKVHRG